MKFCIRNTWLYPQHDNCSKGIKGMLSRWKAIEWCEIALQICKCMSESIQIREKASGYTGEWDRDEYCRHTYSMYLLIKLLDRWKQGLVIWDRGVWVTLNRSWILHCLQIAFFWLQKMKKTCKKMANETVRGRYWNYCKEKWSECFLERNVRCN